MFSVFVSSRVFQQWKIKKWKIYQMFRPSNEIFDCLFPLVRKRLMRRSDIAKYTKYFKYQMFRQNSTLVTFRQVDDSDRQGRCGSRPVEQMAPNRCIRWIRTALGLIALFMASLDGGQGDRSKWPLCLVDIVIAGRFNGTIMTRIG